MASWVSNPGAIRGGGVRDFRNNLVVIEELQAAAQAAPVSGLTLHNDIACRTFSGTAPTQRAAAAGIAAGTLITAIAMTEPGIGGDWPL